MTGEKPGGEASGATGLVFRWERDGAGAGFKLAGFVLVSVLVHGLFFYLFRVVYPTSERVLPTPVEVLLLAEESPGVQPLLRALGDREAAFSSSRNESVSGALDLGTYASVYEEAGAIEGGTEIGYQPTYYRYEPGLLAWPGFVPEVELPELAASGSIPVLAPEVEPVAAVVREGVVETVGERVSVLPGGALEGRKLVVRPEVEGGAWTEVGTGRVVFMVGVERSGRVLYRLPTDQGGVAEMGDISKFVGQLVFEPAEAGAPGVEWGMVELIW